jgi:hypothetical protein
MLTELSTLNFQPSTIVRLISAFPVHHSLGDGGSLQHSAFRPPLPDVLKVRPISDHGNVAEIAQRFGGFEQLGEAVNELQALLYTDKPQF